MTEKMIIDAYVRIRTIDQTIPDDVLDFMKNASLEKLRKHSVIKSVCGNLHHFTDISHLGRCEECLETRKP
jgi:hypothetical protein